MANRKRRTTSPHPSPSPSPPRKVHSSQSNPTPPLPHPAAFSTTITTTSTSTYVTPATDPSPATATPSTLQSAEPSVPSTPLPVDIDMNRCPFTLTSPRHNLLLTLLTQSSNTPHPWIKCHKCGKWRKLPSTLSALTPLLPSLPLTLQSLSSLSAPFLPYPFTCAAVHWDLDRRICSAIQDYQDIVHEWHQVPLKLVRANPRFDFYVALAHFLRVKGVTIREYPCIYGKSVDLYALYNTVHWAGGDAEVTRQRWWPAVYERLRLGGKAGQAADVDYLIEIYRSYFFEWQESKPVTFDATDQHDSAPIALVAAAEVKDNTRNTVVGATDAAVRSAGEAVGGTTGADSTEEVMKAREEVGEGHVDEASGAVVERKEDMETDMSCKGTT